MKSQITLTIDPGVKEKATEIFKSHGQKFSAVFELYLKEIIKEEHEKK